MRSSSIKFFAVLSALLLPAACAAGSFAAEEEVVSAGSFASGWKLVPERTSGRRTLYRTAREGEAVVLKASSQAASSGLMKQLSIDPREYPIVRWRWKVENLVPGADLWSKKGDDAPARLLLSFETDPRQAKLREKLFVKAAKLVYGDYPLAEGLNYVWAGREPAGSIVPSPYTGRLKTIVVESGSSKLKSWVVEERNYYEDYKLAFGKEPPPLYGVAVMTDTDNTGGAASASYGDIIFARAPGYGTISGSAPSMPEAQPLSREAGKIISKNIDGIGRVARAVGGLLLFMAACVLAAKVPAWPVWKTVTVISLLCGGTFMLFEALSGWCALRACGIKTPF